MELNIIKGLLREATSTPNQAKVNSLLDKISQSGIKSLSQEELDTLNGISSGKKEPKEDKPEEFKKGIIDYYLDGMFYFRTHVGKLIRKRIKKESYQGDYFEIHFINGAGDTIIVVNDYIAQVGDKQVEESEAIIASSIWDGVRDHMQFKDDDMPNFFDYYFKKEWQMQIENVVSLPNL